MKMYSPLIPLLCSFSKGYFLGGRAGDTLPETNSQNPSKKAETQNEAGSSPNHPFSGAVAAGFRECNLETVVLPQKNWKVSIDSPRK